LARIAGVDLPKNKRIEVALTYIYGIGRSSSNKILEKLNIDKNLRTFKLDPEQVNKIRKHVEDEVIVEGELRNIVGLNIKRLVDLRSFRGIRHRKNLPVRGQRTKTNARTRKGPRKLVAGKKKAPTAK